MMLLKECAMRTRVIMLGLCGVVVAASLAGCGTPWWPAAGQYSTDTDVSPFPDARCNPALVANPNFLAPNEGGAGGPAPPGIGAATGSWCYRGEPIYGAGG